MLTQPLNCEKCCFNDAALVSMAKPLTHKHGIGFFVLVGASTLISMSASSSCIFSTFFTLFLGDITVSIVEFSTLKSTVADPELADFGVARAPPSLISTEAEDADTVSSTIIDSSL